MLTALALSLVAQTTPVEIPRCRVEPAHVAGAASFSGLGGGLLAVGLIQEIVLLRGHIKASSEAPDEVDVPFPKVNAALYGLAAVVGAASLIIGTSIPGGACL